MKFLRILCNILLCFALCSSLLILQICCYDVLAVQSSSISGIHIFPTDENGISFSDAYTFWVVDIKANLKQENKYRIRNWSTADWWKTGGIIPDGVLDTVIAVVKPIVVPVAEMNAIKNYYGLTINDFSDYLVNHVYNGDEVAANNALYELYTIFGRGYGEACIIGTNIPISEYAYSGQYELDLSEEYTYGDYGRWVAKNSKLYNTSWKLTKYNSEEFSIYFSKFISNDNGVRNIKPAAIVLYYAQLLALIISIIFVIKYPISFLTGRYIGSKKEKTL